LEKVIDEYKAAYNICSQHYKEYLWKSSAHTSFWKAEFLREFCSFVNDRYENGINELEIKWDWHKEQGIKGGVIDMSLLYLFYLKNKNSIYNLLPVSKGNICFDYNINGSLNYKQDEYQTIKSPLGTIIKDVKIQNEKPYCYNLLSNSDVQFANLHFQGIAKYFCHNFFTINVSVVDRLRSSIFLRWIYLKLKVKTMLRIYI
jgi:hypothetical protein